MTLFFIFIFGLCIGSFLNVLIDRLPNNKSINGRSHCDYCKKTLSWIDLIPVISYLLLKGKCRYCKKKLSIQYPIIELLTGGIFVFVAIYVDQFVMLNSFQHLNEIPNQVRDDIIKVAYWGLTTSLLVIFVADLKYHIIPDSMQVSLLLFSVMLKFFQHPSSQVLKQVQDDFISGLIIMLPILFLFLITRGRGMGFGDVKLAFTIGFFLGRVEGFLALYIAFILGALVSIFLLLKKKAGMKTQIAFGPFLVLGIVVMLFWGEQVYRIVTQWFSF